ncbi:MAG: diaminopimelate decarboxylase [Candidatus Hydrogenedentes bacterium]|nr:diaminopimelate decarboxylase [Candidatus Hydrogenedentota bacterium]
MSGFAYKNGIWQCEEIPVERIAEAVGTPFYLYSRAELLERYHALDQAFENIPHLVCFALKANGNLALNRILAEAGCGAEVVSGGELFRSLRAGYQPERIVFDGNGKTEVELRYALESGIYAINVDSENELQLLNTIAGEINKIARVGLRVNPDVNPNTHPKIATGLKKSKFGVDLCAALRCYEFARDAEHLEVVGIHAHIGSQIVEVGPFAEAMGKLIELALELQRRNITLQYIDIGGGLGIQYNAEIPPCYAEYIGALRPHWERYPVTIIVEPGRSLVGDVGNLITKVLYVKQTPVKRFVVIDAAMNDLWRPTMYDAYHQILPVRQTNGHFVADVVGGVCESGDFMARDREMATVSEGELLAIQSAGAYSASMSSEYNSRPLIPEVLVTGDTFRLVRRRPTYDEMMALEE